MFYILKKINIEYTSDLNNCLIQLVFLILEPRVLIIQLQGLIPLIYISFLFVHSDERKIIKHFITLIIILLLFQRDLDRGVIAEHRILIYIQV